MQKIEYTSGVSRHTNRQRITAHVPVPQLFNHGVTSIKRHLAFINVKNDGRFEVTMKRVKDTDSFKEPRWRPTFDQKVVATEAEARALIEACWHDEEPDGFAMDFYVLHMQGGGDIDVRLVTKETWDWIGQPFDEAKAEHNAYYEEVPRAVRAVAAFHDQLSRFHENHEVFITSGSFENDRALAAPGIQFDSLGEALQFINLGGHKLIDTFDGYIY